MRAPVFSRTRGADAPVKFALKLTVECLLVAACLGLATAGWARAQEATHYGASASTRRPLVARNSEDATAAGTELSLEDRPIALETTAEAIREVPGVRLVRTGAYGTFSGVQLRGSSLGQTAWVFEEVPLSSADGGGFDLSTLPMPLLQRLEVYRGGAPLWYSQGALGGVVRAVSPEAHETGAEATLGAGSYGRYEGSANAHARSTGRIEVSQYSVLQVVSSQGDFEYLDDRGTVTNTEDDAIRRIRNAQTLDLAGLSHTRVDLPVGRLDLILTGFERSGGVPGEGGHGNTLHTHRDFWRGLGVLAYTQERQRHDGSRLYRLQLSGSFMGQRNRVSDPGGELGNRGPSFRDDLWKRGWGRAAGSLGVTRWLELTSLLSHTYERFDSRDLRSGSGRPARRDTTSLALEARLHGSLGGKRLELRPSLLAMHGRSQIPIANLGRAALLDERRWLPVLRVGAAFEPAPRWTLRSSVANGGRWPSVLELYGDAGYVMPNRELLPESGWNWDVGVVASGCRGPFHGSLELSVYWQRLDDLIVFKRTAGNNVTAENEREATLWGSEIGLDGFAGDHLHTIVSLTTTVSENQFGDELPFQPRLRAYARQEVPFYFARGVLSSLIPHLSVEHVGRRYADSHGTSSMPAFTRLGAGVSAGLWQERIELSFRADNLLNSLNDADTLVFPLPGRSFFVSLTLREERI